MYIRNLTQALIHAGHQVLSFTRKTSASDQLVVLDEATGSRVIPLSVGQLSLPKEALGELTTQFADELVNGVTTYATHDTVLHSHYWLSGMVAHHAALQLRAPVVHTMHTLGATKNISAPGTEPIYRVEREAFICARAQVITANTRVERQELVAHTGVDPARVEVVHPGVDHQIFQPDGPAVWPGRVSDETPRVLFAGRQQRYKGPHVVLQALATLRDRGFHKLPVVHFTGAVSGSPDYDVQAQAHLLGVAQWCSFSSPVTPETLAGYMRAADVVAMPSVTETFGLVALEAQACGTPVIAHKVGGLTTAVAEGVSGQLVDSLSADAWADVLESVVDDPQRWKAYGAAGCDHSAQFSWSAMADRMVDIYGRAMTANVASSSEIG